MPLTDYRTLGRSGLVVSPLALGTMTFGTARWGSGEATSRAVFDAYVEAGGNFFDTADVYAGGRSEEMLGRLHRRAVAASRRRPGHQGGVRGREGSRCGRLRREAPPCGARGIAEAAPDRLRRSLLAARLGRRDAGRRGAGDDGGLRPRRERSATGACRMRRRGSVPSSPPWRPAAPRRGRSPCSTSIRW